MEQLDNLTQHIRNTLINNLFTFLPGIVTSVNDLEDLQAIDVRPTVSKFYSDGVTLTPPVLYKVPLILPSAGGGLLSFPINVGDTVLLIFSCRDMDNWLGGDGDTTTPYSNRHHNLSDAIAIPGLYPFANNLGPSGTDVFLNFSDSKITLKASGGIDITTTTNIDVNAVDVNIHSTGSVNLGDGGQAIARVGDNVEVTVVGGGSYAGETATGTITSGSLNNTST